MLLADERKPLSKQRDEIERSETRRKEVAKKHGLPMTQKEFKEKNAPKSYI